MNRRPRPAHDHTAIPVALPQAIVRPAADSTLSISIDGDALATGPIRQAELGGALTHLAHEHGCAIRVEVHDRDGGVYADIIDPPQPTPATDPPPHEPTKPKPGSEVGGGGFVPGEPVHVAVVVTTETADADGRLTADLGPQHLDDEVGLVILFGAVSGRTIVHGEP